MADYTLESDPQAELSVAPIKVKKADRCDLGQAVYTRIVNALGDRSQLDIDLDYWNDLYEMVVGEKNWPWPNSANVFIPLIPTQLDTLAARLTATVFPPRLFLVNGNTDESAKTDHQVERFYNAELARYHWTEVFYQWMHLSLRDGTSILKIGWKKETRKRKVIKATPIIDEETGMPVPDEKDPTKPKMTTEMMEVVETIFDDVFLEPIELKDFLLLPSYSKSCKRGEVSGIALKRTYDEWQLRAMARGDDPDLWMKAVDEVLESQAEAQDQIPQDPQGVRTLEIGGEITISGMDGTQVGNIRQKKGQFIIWEVYTDSYSFDGSGEPEPAILWIDDQTQTLMGAKAYPYWHGEWPFVDLSPSPRLNRFYGFSMAGRLRYLQEETNAIHNQKLDVVDRALGAPMYQTDGANIKDENMRWAPNAMWQVSRKDDIGFLVTPAVPIEAQVEEQALMTAAQGVTGLSAPMTGQTNSGRKTAKEVQQAAASAGVRLDLMAARIRDAMKRVFLQIHALKLQYGPDDMQTQVANPGGKPARLQITKAILAQDYDLSIAGLGGPIDKQGRQQSMLFLYTLLMKNPLIMQDPMKIYAVSRMLLEEYDRVDIPTLLGTQEELMKKMQQAAQQAQQAAAMGQPPPGQNPQQQQGGQQQQQKPQTPNQGPKVGM
jgi:hypothetical protein